MRTLRKNKQKLKYALRQERQPIYALDKNGDKVIEYTDDDGNIYYKETGSYTSVWSEPVDFFANISMSGGEAQAQEYGLDISQYNATMFMSKGEIPIVEGSLIWLKSEPKYLDEKKTDLDDNSADFVVLKVSESQNFVRYVLKAKTKQVASYGEESI